MFGVDAGIMRMLRLKVVDSGRGIVRACAGDIGTALRTLRSLSWMFPVFAHAEALAGLTLKLVSVS